MPSYPNIEKSKLRSGEYVGYGAGRVWRIRKLSKWHAMAMLPASRDRDYSMPDLAGYKLADISAQLAALPIEPGKLLPAVDFPITLIGDPGHAAAQAETVRRLTNRRG